MRLHSLSFVVLLFAFIAMVAVPSNVQAQQQDAYDATFEDLITALETSDAQVEALEQAYVQEVQVVNVGDIRATLDDDQHQVLDAALRDAETGALHASLHEQEAVATALDQEGVAVGDVVAVSVRGESDVVVFYDSDV